MIADSNSVSMIVYHIISPPVTLRTMLPLQLHK